MNYLEELGMKAEISSHKMSLISAEEKRRGLLKVADELEKKADEILKANSIDVKFAEEKGIKASLIDRLKVTDERIRGMADGLREVAELPDPIGIVLNKTERPNGLVIEKISVPIGVIGIIYESRPNVTADAFALTFMSGNTCILKGGSDAINSNIAIANIIRGALSELNLPEDSILLIESTDRKVTNELMHLNQYVDLLIPRGGSGLIKTVIRESTIPVIETGTGNCHIYVDETADIGKAKEIIFNAKTQRYGVCNACESLVIHENILQKALPEIAEKLESKNVEIRADKKARTVYPKAVPTAEEDFATEYLDAIISVKTVSSIDEAISHINKYNTGHSEAIITEDMNNAEKFLKEVDASAVYVNASTRFTDGNMFGFGAEIGISTQKIHARGPMGLEALTSYKYIIHGNGQIR